MRDNASLCCGHCTLISSAVQHDTGWYGALFTAKAGVLAKSTMVGAAAASMSFDTGSMSAHALMAGSGEAG